MQDVDDLLAIFYALSGFFMKISDDCHDKKQNKALGLAAAIFCGICIGYLAVNSADAACIFLAVLIGTVAAWKVDCLNHLLSLLIFGGIILLGGIPTIGLTTLLICAAAAFLDEVGNDNKWTAQNRTVHIFFQYRFALKMVIFLFALLGSFHYLGLFQSGLLASIPGIQFFSWETLLFFLLFELSYELVGLKFNVIYDGFYSLLRIFRLVDGPTDD